MTRARQIAYHWLDLPIQEQIQIEKCLGIPNFFLSKNRQENDKMIFVWVNQNKKVDEFAKLIERARAKKP